MTEKNTQQNSIHVGSSLILVTFVLLCLVTFSILALTSAKSDYTMTLETAQNTTDYYNAANQAEQKLADISSVLKECLRNSSDASGYFQELKHHLSSDESVLLNQNTDTMIIEFVIPINASRTLQVSLSAGYPQNNNEALFSVEVYKSIAEPIIDDTVMMDDTNYLFR